jgi:ribosomal protein L11 methyltransferase
MIEVCGSAADLFTYSHMHHLQVTISTADPDLQEILIALLPALGYEGFEQQDDALQAFVPEEQFDAGALDQLLRETPGLVPEPSAGQPSAALPYSAVHLEERNWNEEWEKNFQPVQVEGFCAIRAHFHAPIPGVIHELVITPKMSFGTGHHATTYMMLQAMKDLDFQGRRVLDFGTGTGVLAILAERLGAAEILAIDNDDWSIDNASENVAANHCTRIMVRKSDSIPAGEPFDIILANINKHVIESQLAVMGQQLAPGGVILLSGLLVDDIKDIESEALRNDLSLSLRKTKDSWICLQSEKMTKISH